MNQIQTKLAELQEKGWTLAALADELGNHVNTVEKWKAGDRQPANPRSVMLALELIAKRKRIPKRRRYAKGSRQRNPGH